MADKASAEAREDRVSVYTDLPEERKEQYRQSCKNYYRLNRAKILARQALTGKIYREQHREAARLYQAKWALANPEKRRAYLIASYNKHRDRLKNRWRNSTERQRKLQLEYKRRWRLTNIHKVRQYHRLWNRNHPDPAKTNRRRAARLGNGIEKYTREAIFKRDGGRCHICNRKVSKQRFHIDHLVPIVLGGRDAPDNVSIAHPGCNMKRGVGKLPAQFPLLPVL